jgi:hypothetical protein
MSPYDVTADDEPLDVAVVAADERMVEQLRHALSPDAAVIWDDDDDVEVDPAFALLRALQRDVSADLPADEVLPASVTELLPRRRSLGRGATVAAIAAGVLSIGGVAAAASAPGLSGVRSAVSNAVHDAVDAITPDAPVGPVVASPSSAASPTATATPFAAATPTPRGQVVSTAARSASAVGQIQANLDRAERFLDQGKTGPAGNQLDAAARKLDYVVAGADRTRLAARLATLRARLAATPDAKPSKSTQDNNANSGSGNNGKSGSDNGKSSSDNNGKSGSDNSGSGNSGSGKGSTPDAKKSPAIEPTHSSSSGKSGSGRVDPKPSEVETPEADPSGSDD